MPQCLVCDGPTRVMDRRERSDRSIRRRRECLACGAGHTRTEIAETGLDVQQRTFQAAQQRALEEAQAAQRQAIETVRLIRAARTVLPEGSLVPGAPVRLPGVAFSRRRVMAPCPTCGGESWVMSHLSRGSDGTVRRRHACRSCFRRFTTVQRRATHEISDESPARIEAVAQRRAATCSRTKDYSSRFGFAVTPAEAERVRSAPTIRSLLRSLVLAYLVEGGSRTRLLALVNDECKAAGLTPEGTAEMLAYWARAVDAATRSHYGDCAVSRNAFVPQTRRRVGRSVDGINSFLRERDNGCAPFAETSSTRPTSETANPGESRLDWSLPPSAVSSPIRAVASIPVGNDASAAAETSISVARIRTTAAATTPANSSSSHR